MKKSFIFYTFLLFLCFTFSAFAQESAISPEKRKIIAEIITVTNAEKGIEDVMQAMMTQMDAMYPAIIHSTLEKQEDLTASEKIELEKTLVENRQDFDRRFREKLLKAINFREYAEATLYPIYNKFFSESELKDLLAFYQTPTGQKLNKIIPQMSAETVRLSQTYLLPKLDKIFEELMKENTEKVKQNPPPAPKKQRIN